MTAAVVSYLFSDYFLVYKSCWAYLLMLIEKYVAEEDTNVALLEDKILTIQKMVYWLLCPQISISYNERVSFDNSCKDVDVSFSKKWYVVTDNKLFQ